MAASMKVVWRDIEARRAAEDGQYDGLLRAAREVLAASNMIVPLDTGVLLGSGAIDVYHDRASVYYDTPYAAKLHQDRKLHIRGGRRVQYLRKAAVSSRPHIVRWFGDAFKIKFAKKKGMK